jgi:hypothetical protein
MPQRVVGRFERDAEEDPAHVVARTRWLARELFRLAAYALSCELRRVSKIDDVALPLLLVPLGRGEVENVIGIDVFLIEPIVVNGAVRL